MPDPRQITTLSDLTLALKLLRLRAPKDELSMRAIADRMGVAASTVHPYLAGKKLCPSKIYESLLRAHGVSTKDLGPWMDAWERVAARMEGPAASPGSRTYRDSSIILSNSMIYLYTLALPAQDAPAWLGIVTGDMRRVRVAELWVNSENTDMQMSRHNEYSVSAIIRFDGARKDRAGRVVEDLIADELDQAIAGQRPVAPATVIATGPGKLAESNQVKHVLHVAAVHGEPGLGFRQVADIGRCVSNALAEAERLAANDPTLKTILFPLLGSGVAGAEIQPTVRAMLGAAIDHMLVNGDQRIRRVLFLAHTEEELAVCRAIFTAQPKLSIVESAS